MSHSGEPKVQECAGFLIPPRGSRLYQLSVSVLREDKPSLSLHLPSGVPGNNNDNIYYYDRLLSTTHQAAMQMYHVHIGGILLRD